MNDWDRWFAQATRNRSYHRKVVLRQLLNHGDQLDRIEAKLDGLHKPHEHTWQERELGGTVGKRLE